MTAVTQQEHRLIVTMLAQQMQISMTILDILRARDVLESDHDTVAFFSLPKAPDVLIRAVGDSYQQVAQQLGVDAPVA
jgi:nucleoside phosphorylase